MKELSIFVDESGDFGAYHTHSPYYIVVMVLHDQSKDISQFIRENLTYFQQFKKIILYYDNGQHELNCILNTVLSAELAVYEMRKVLPRDYKLFQAADLICTLELLQLKSQNRELTRSESLIFHSKKNLKKDFLKGLHKKLFKPFQKNC